MARTWARRALIGLLIANVVFLAWVGARLYLDNWDGFDYLGNALLMAGRRSQTSFVYNDSRPPLVSLLIVPALAFWRPEGGGSAVWGPHFVCLLLAVLGLWVAYRLLRVELEPLESTVGAALIGLGPLFVHYAPFVMCDAASMTFAAAALWAYLRAAERRSAALSALAGACVGLATAAKYPAGLLLLALALFEVSGWFRGGIQWRNGRPWLTVLAALLAFYAVHFVSFRLGLPAGESVWDRLRSGMQAVWSTNSRPTPLDPWFEYFSELEYIAGIPALFFAVVGVAGAVWRRSPSDRLHLAWLLVFLGVMTLKVAHKEARYVFPVLPSLAFFACSGLGWLRGRSPSAAWVGLLILCAVPIARGFAEARRFFDPVYSRPWVAEIAQWIRQRAGTEQRVLVTGNDCFSAYPAHPVVMRYDEFNHFHHLNKTSFEYYLGRPVEQTWNGADLSPQALARDFPRGGAMISLPAGFIDANNGATAPEPPLPLELIAVTREGGTERKVWGIR